MTEQDYYLILALVSGTSAAITLWWSLRQLIRQKKAQEAHATSTTKKAPGKKKLGKADQSPLDAATEKKLASLEKERVKQHEKLEAERKKREQAKQEEKKNRLKEEERKIQEELKRKEQELKQKQEPSPPPATDEVAKPASFVERLKSGVSKTRRHLVDGIGDIVYGKREIDEELLEELEELLIEADIGTTTTSRILASIQGQIDRNELKDPQAVKGAIKDEIVRILTKNYQPATATAPRPKVILIIGVNGVGKTTTIGKIASHYRTAGNKVILGAGDTFRAAAIEQLTEWSKRAEVDIVAKNEGSDPSAVMYQAVERALKEQYDVVICDTAGRLHTKSNLMEELKKMIRVIKKLVPEAPHEVLLVLDATTGQNAVFQTREFLKAADITGLVVTKLDGTAKGGVIIGIVNEFEIPVKYIGVGEQIDDLRPFEPQQFSESLFG